MACFWFRFFFVFVFWIGHSIVPFSTKSKLASNQCQRMVVYLSFIFVFQNCVVFLTLPKMNKNKCSRFLFIELLISSRKKHLCYSWICNRSDRIDHNRYISTNSTRFQFECFSKNSISKINNFSLHFLFFFFRSFQLLLVIFHWFQLKCDQTYFFL